MPRVELSKAYSPRENETRIYENWDARGYFKASIRKDRKPYVIMLPPPNVTGMLTLGHVLNHTTQDILIRWRRMCGDDVLWLPGTDHAGIATQIKVEAALAKDGVTRHDLGREALVEKIWEWKHNFGGIILKQLRRLGASCDWSRERFTLDESLSRGVSEIFVRLYKKGLVYRGKRIVNWDPVSHTALSDEQVEYRNLSSHLWHLRYPLSDGSGHLTVATTRPETMLGDAAVAVHPEDDRFRHLHGKTIRLPLVGKEIPIVPDDFVDQEFGTGCVKVTPAHDPNDFEIGERHNLEFISVIGTDGCMTDECPEEFRGLDCDAARELVVQRFEEQNLLDKVEPYTHSVGHNGRSGAVIEPLLSEQWFVSMKGLAEPAIRAVREGRVQFTPKHWEKTYFHWLENVRDWCISRQIWWGHRIPLWTVKETGEVICSVDDPTQNPKYKGLTLEQDPDVLDTWFSSWLWPFSTLGWPDQTEDLDHFFPSTTLVTGPDIIFLWVARMIMASEEVFGVAPYQHVYFTGMVRDLKGRKMSKSLGNSPNPLDVIDQYGADALRFTVVSQTPRGGDIRFGTDLCELGRNFANKIWNASRFLLMNLPEESETFEFTPVDALDSPPENLIDCWITSAYFSAVRDVTRHLDEFHFSEAVKRIQSFIWNDFCDWYLELLKARLQEGGEARDSALRHALGILHGALRLAHPVMPFITEELYQTLRGMSEQSWPEEFKNDTIMRAPFPKVREEFIVADVEQRFSELESIVSAIRNIRGELGINPSVKIRAGIHSESGPVAPDLSNYAVYIVRLAGLGELEFDSSRPPGSASAILGRFEVYVPLEGVVDVDAEINRLSKESARLTKLSESTSRKLSNEKFVERAKPEVVENERKKLTDAETALVKINQFISELESIQEG